MHRDLKPANILVKSPDDDLDIKICDFGLATFVNVDKYIYPRCETPGFVAPEIINLKDEKHKYDTKCDIYSLGIIMFTM